ncbi:MAG: AI-2E family transporter [Planctomycetota bacterium]
MPKVEPARDGVGGKAKRPTSGDRLAPRIISLVMLVVVVLLVGAIFFRVMLQFIAPLFLAGVMVVVFEPLHKRVTRRIPNRPEWAAAVTTGLIAAFVLIPITWLGLVAFIEMSAVVKPFLQEAASADHSSDESALSGIIEQIRERYPEEIETYEETFSQNFEEQVKSGVNAVSQSVLETGVHTFFSAISFMFALGIMSFAMYYFFADGPAMIEAFIRLSPLDDRHERELLAKFSEVSRAVVTATLLSAAAQGLLAGLGYALVLEDGPVFLLTALTMLMAIVPFVGATIVWAPVVAWVYFVQDNPGWALGFFLWCAIAVSNIDNIIKPIVLHGQSKLHPLMALLSVLGGVTVLGPVGILVGPMLVAFLQALLNMLKKELDLFRAGSAKDTDAEQSEDANSPAVLAAESGG